MITEHVMLRSGIRSGFLILAMMAIAAAASAQVVTPAHPGHTDSTSKYIDQTGGTTADQAVEQALRNNPELVALRNEAAAGEALLRQARLRANPSLETGGTRQSGGPDNSLMVQGELPLELGGRRAARSRLAEQELEIRRLAVVEKERQLASEIRVKFGEILAAIFKLAFTEEMLATATENYELVAARVTEGRRPPLEQNLEVVELNRIRAMREAGEGTVEVKMFELRNILGMEPESLLRLRGTFDGLVLSSTPPRDIATAQALQTRPDLAGARAVEALAAARIGQAKAEGRIDADVMVGYQRMRSGFPLLGIEEHTGALLPIDSKFHFFTFGVRLMLPVFDRKQGMLAAAQLERDAARSRREFGELTIKREVAAAYARHDRALRAMEIYRVGVRDQARQNLQVVRQTYELGSKTLLDYIGEHHRYIETENGFIDAQLEAYLARVEILVALNARELLNK